MDNKKRITYPEPRNLKYILRYYKTKIDKYIKASGNKDMLKIYAKEISKLLVGDINDYEIAIYDKLTNIEEVKCSRCNKVIRKSYILMTEKDNLSFCSNCGLIRLIYDRSDITDYTYNNADLINKLRYIVLDDIIVYEDLYNRAIMSVIGKLKNRLEKYINGDITAIEKSEELTEKEIKD